MRAPSHLVGLLGTLLFLNGGSLGCGGEPPADGPGGTGAAGGAGGATTSGTTKASSSSASGGGGPCTPGAERACYSGPAGTEGVGLCKAGAETCNAQGTAYGACEGEVLPEAEACHTPEDEDCDGAAPACTGDHLWSQSFGDESGGHYAESIATDANGDVLVTGRFEGTVNFGGPTLTSAGDWDAFVAKLDAAGNHLWSKSFGDSSYQHAESVATDEDGNVLLTGYFDGTVNFGGAPLTNAGFWDVFVAKLAP